MSLRWSILGVGRAGRARARAIAADPRAAAVCGWRGDPERADLPVAASLEDALSRCDAVAVCAADSAHVDLVEASLRAGKHVLCEYPLAPSVAEVRRLREMADERGLVLHVEHIELLGPPAQWWRTHGPHRVDRGVVRFTSSRDDGAVVLGNLARLHRLMDIAGAPTQVQVQERSPTSLAATVRCGGSVQLDFRFAPGLKRETVLDLQTERGHIVQRGGAIELDGVDQGLPKPSGLFAADQLVATAAILDGAPPYVSWERIEAGLRLAEVLRDAALGVERSMGREDR